jgi:hypothetical protein
MVLRRPVLIASRSLIPWIGTKKKVNANPNEMLTAASHEALIDLIFTAQYNGLSLMRFIAIPTFLIKKGKK